MVFVDVAVQKLLHRHGYGIVVDAPFYVRESHIFKVSDLLNHGWHHNINESGYGPACEQQGDDNGQQAVAQSAFVLQETHHRVEQISYHPCYKERYQHPAQIV